MNFLNPEYFWLLLFLVPFFIYRNFRSYRIHIFGYMLSFIFITIALSRPVLPQKPIENEQVLSDVVVAVDLSYSMQAHDISPTRLSFAKETLASLVKHNSKSRYGVLGFTTNAIILSPLTQDSELLLHLFSSLDEKLIITKGSSIMPALVLARKLSKSKHLSVVLLSDGGDEVDYSDEAAFAKKEGLVVNTFMIGTKSGTTLHLENGEILKDEIGDIVVSRLNENISVISNASGGVSTDNYDDLLSALASQNDEYFKSKSTLIQNLELFYYFIFLALLIFLVSVTTLKRYIVAFLFLFGISVDASLVDLLKNENVLSFKEANRLYSEGEYEKALVKYKRIRSSSYSFKSRVYYNMANTLVRLKEFKKARESYHKSLTLNYTNEAYENMQYIKDVSEQEQMSTGQQKTKKKSSFAKQKESTQKKKKSGGSSNMKVSANASNGASDNAKKTKGVSMLNLNSAKAKLSSQQYELVNKRGANEKRPW